MKAWLSDNLGNIIVLLVLAAAVGGALFTMIRRKRAGKGSCSCGCAACAMREDCEKRR